jgi:hypothetical protein
LSSLFPHWEHRVTTDQATDTAVFGHEVTVEVVAAELRRGATPAWEESGLTLRRDGCLTVVEPYRPSEERAAEEARRAAVAAQWAEVLAETDGVDFDQLAVGDVLVRGEGDCRRAMVLRPPEGWTDLFGRRMSKLWCRALDGTGREGWIAYGPGGRTRRVSPSAGLDIRCRTAIPLEEGYTAVCGRCGSQIRWGYDDPRPERDALDGRWTDNGGRDLCPAADEKADDQFHQRRTA